ncbi:MAG: hypothetical protein JSR61_11000 [Proteobacteria bacterium]|nr:hypothetical protein [Pseudomonadota bacterium]
MTTARSKQPSPNRKTSSVKGALAAAMLLATSAAQAGDVRLYVLAPQPPASLKTVETQGSDKPAYSHSYDISYNTVEQNIRNEIKKANIDLGGAVICEGACPNVYWHVSVSNDFSFTLKNQPTITAFGNAQDNGVDVYLKTQFKLHTVVSARLWADPATGHVEGTAHVPIDLVIGMEANSKLALWPEVKSIASYCETTKLQETACVKLTLDDKNIDLSDPKGIAVAVGTALGGLIGGSPLAAGIADPLSGLIAGKLISEELVKIAARKVQDEADKVLNNVLQIANIRATWLASNYVDAKATQANAVRSKLLDTKLPGVNKSLQELSTALGLSLDVQTRTSSGDVYVIVTPRFTANPAGGTMVGKLRMPKEACVYGEWQYGTIPLGLTTVDANRELAGKVGKPCTDIMSASDIKLAGYLGADPKIVKVGANPLPNWKPVGTFKLTGNLSEVKHGTVLQSQLRQRGTTRHAATGYYECSFEISGLPGADIIELDFKGKAAERMAGFQQEPNRYVEVAAAGVSAALDASWAKAGPPVVIGGDGKCTAGKVRAPHYQAESWLDRIEDLLDLDKCPNCGIKLDEGMLKASNMKPILENPALKPLFDALAAGRALPAATQAPATQAPAGQQAPATGVQRGPALRPELLRPGLQKGVNTPK